MGAVFFLIHVLAYATMVSDWMHTRSNSSGFSVFLLRWKNIQ